MRRGEVLRLPQGRPLADGGTAAPAARSSRQFERVKRSKQLVTPASILFADIRGYTSFSEVIDSPQAARLLSHFYENCATEIWELDGIVNKLIGDAVLAVFNFPIAQEDHVRRPFRPLCLSSSAAMN